MKQIELTQGFSAIVDDSDYDELSRRKWHYCKGYALRSVNVSVGKEKKVSMHSIIMGKITGLEIDHINGNSLDNRRENLRHVTKRQNQQNQMSPRGTSIYKGVHWDKYHSKWRARIKLNGKKLFLGDFSIESEAGRAYNEAASSLFGQYARLNTF